MPSDRPQRRRSPWWIRELPRQKVHAIAAHLDALWRSDGISDAQAHLLDGCISELDYRNRRAASGDRCTCRICFGPFDSSYDELRAPERPAMAPLGLAAGLEV